MEDTRALRLFLGVANSGSFRKAAVEAGISPQAVSKAVKQLEARLGIKLLHRSTRHVSLTEEGERLFRSADPGMRMLKEALEGIEDSKREMAGTLRLAAPLAFGNRVLVRLMDEFQASYPDIHFDLLLSDDFVDTVSLRIDVGFRTGTPPERNVISRKLGEIVSTICAARSYLDKFGGPSTLNDLYHHRCTGFLHPHTGKEIPWEIQQDGEITFISIPSVARFNNIESEIEAVKRGVGIGQLSEYLVREELAAGELVALMPELRSVRLGIYMYYAQRNQMPLRVRKFIDFCQARI